MFCVIWLCALSQILLHPLASHCSKTSATQESFTVSSVVLQCNIYSGSPNQTLLFKQKLQMELNLNKISMINNDDMIGLSK